MPIINMVYKKKSRLPSAYQEVEYIESSGTQYFTVWNSFKTSYKVVIDFQMTVIGGDYIPVGIHYYGGGNNVKYWVDCYSSKLHVSGGGNWTATITEDTNRHTVTIDKNTTTVDGTDYTINYTDYTYSQWIWVFCYNEYHNTPPYSFMSSNKLYKLDIYDDNWTHIYEIIPCYRKNDSVIWAYDLVNDVFITNQWTWTFTKWPNV